MIEIELNRNITSPATTKDGTSTMDFAPKYIAVAQELSERGESLLRSPYMIEIEPEATCQLKCAGCSYKRLREEQVLNPLRRRINFKFLKSLIDDVEGLDTHGIFISGGGEPLNYPEIEELISYCGEHISPVSIQTNGLALHKLLQNPSTLDHIRLITVSVYGSDPQSFQDTTGRGEKMFEAFIDSMNNFMNLKNHNELPDGLVITGKILITQGNYQKVVDMIRMCESWNVDAVLLREIQNIETGKPLLRDKILNQNQRTQMVNSLREVSDRPFVSRFISDVAYARDITAASSCYTASMGMLAIIDTDGYVYTGTPEIGEKRFAIGNIYEKSFADIWGSNQHRQVVKEVVQTQSERGCLIDNCRHAPSHLTVENYSRIDGNSIKIKDVIKTPLGGFI